MFTGLKLTWLNVFFSEKFPCDAGFTVLNRMEIFQLEFIKKFSSGRLISPEIRFR